MAMAGLGANRPISPTIEPGHSFATITDHISTIVLRKKTPIGWLIGYVIAFVMARAFENELYRVPLVVATALLAFEELLTRKDLKGRISLLTEMRDTMGLALLAQGADPVARDMAVFLEQQLCSHLADTAAFCAQPPPVA